MQTVILTTDSSTGHPPIVVQARIVTGSELRTAIVRHLDAHDGGIMDLQPNRLTIKVQQEAGGDSLLYHYNVNPVKPYFFGSHWNIIPTSDCDDEITKSITFECGSDIPSRKELANALKLMLGDRRYDWRWDWSEDSSYMTITIDGKGRDDGMYFTLLAHVSKEGI